jgi:Tfp pilus assembly protein PilV
MWSVVMCGRVHKESGFALVEVLMSAVVLTLVAGAVLTALISTKEAGAQERFRTQAQAIAQQDQARIRAMRISTLTNSFTQSRTVSVDGNNYTVQSTANYVTDDSSTTSCTQNTASTQYVRISSSVSWPSLSGRPAVLLSSLMAVPAGSSTSTRGTLQVSIQDSTGAPKANVPVTGSGPANLSGTTSANGCITWGNIATGTYTVTPTLAGAVNKDGVAPAAQTVDVLGQTTKTLALQYDTPGQVNVSYQFTGYPAANTLTAGTAVGVGVSQTGMTIDRFFGTGALLTTQSTTKTLFPFTSAYGVYAGTCSANNPGSTTGGGVRAVTLAPNATVNLNTTATKVQLFPLYLTAYQGTSGTPGVKSSGATVVIKDLDCPKTYNFTTNASGQLAMPGLPYSDYSVCVRGPSTVGTRTYQNASIAVKSTSGTTLNVYLASGTTTPTTCP